MITPILPVYSRADLAFDRGEGPYLFTADGRRYLDFAAGIAVSALGHSHPHLVDALVEQGRKLWHVSNLYQIPQQQRLAERLIAHSFADTVFFGNSGAEAGECAIKLVRKHHSAAGRPERHRMITCTGAFHGRTLATLAAAGNRKYLDGFAPDLEGFDNVAFGNLNELRAAITPETAGIMVETVQGEGGIRPASKEYLQGLRETADEFGLLLVFDEVQCGMGRTGRLFAYEWSGVEPDVMMVAKGLGGGFPIGACLATEQAASGMGPGAHGSTFGGNPLAMAIGNAVLDVILADGFLSHVEDMGRSLREKLEELRLRYPGIVAEVRGQGLMLGLKCEVTNTTMQAKLRDAGLLTVTAGDNVVRIMPPLIVEETHLAEADAMLERVCADWGR